MDEENDLAIENEIGLDEALEAAFGQEEGFTPDTDEEQGGEPETQQGEPEQGEGTAAPAPDATQEQQAQQQGEGFKPEGPGDLRVALHQERQQRQALAQQYAALEAQQQQMAQMLATFQQQAQQAEIPDADLDPEGYRQWEIQQALAPMQQQMAQMQAFYQQQANEARLAALEAQHPGARELVGKVAHLPALAGFDPQAQYYFAIGAQFANPTARAALIKADVDAAVQAAIQQLTPQKPTAPRTLATLPTAKGGNALTPDSLTGKDIERHGLDILDLFAQ